MNMNMNFTDLKKYILKLNSFEVTLVKNVNQNQGGTQ